MRNEKGQFIKGNIPWIKGKKGVTSANSGSFKKGHNPKNKGIKGWTNSGSFKKGHSLDENSLKKLVVEEIKKTLDFGDLYVFDRDLPRVEGIDEQGFRYKGMQVNIDKLLALSSDGEKKGEG